MEGFVHSKYYVECRTPEEVHEFMNMCEEAGLKLRSGKYPSQFDLCCDKGAVFAYNWAGSGDGISCWRWNPYDGFHSDEKRLHVDFQNVKRKQINTSTVELLNLL